MNVKCPISPGFPRCCANLSSKTESATRATAMSVRDIVAEVELGDVILDDNTRMDYTPSSIVCVSNSYETARCQHVKS